MTVCIVMMQRLDRPFQKKEVFIGIEYACVRMYEFIKWWR